VIAHPIQEDAARVLENLGGDASVFAARQLTRRIASDADLILTMTVAHRDAVLELAPHKLRRTFILTEASSLITECNAQTFEDLAALRPQLAVSERQDVPDPIGQGPEAFAAIGAQIAGLLAPILWLCQRSSIHTVD
jgi:protein-tyrosine phosphatase